MFQPARDWLRALDALVVQTPPGPFLAGLTGNGYRASTSQEIDRYVDGASLAALFRTYHPWGVLHAGEQWKP